MKKKKENIENQDPNLEKIRHYRGTWDNFFDFWKSKGVEVDPYKGTLLKYPTEKIYKGRENVHQDFDTYKKSKTLKENMKHIKTFDDFINEAKTITERYNKKSLLKKLGSADDATIQTGNGKEYIIYNPNNNNDDNTAMWGDKTIFALDQDGGEHEIAYKDIGLVMVESAVNEAEKYITNGYKLGDKIKTNIAEWQIIKTNYKPRGTFASPFVFRDKEMEQLPLNVRRTTKGAVGYKVTDGAKYPIFGFLYQYMSTHGKSLITKLAIIDVDESVNEGSDQARLTHLRKFGIAPNNQPQNGAYIKSVSKPGKFFVDWKDAFKLGDVALEFIKSSGSESVFDIIDLKTMKRTGKQLDVKKGDLGNLRTTYGVRVSESVVNEKTSFSQMKKDSKTKEYKEVSNAIEGAQEISDIWNMLDPKMFKFSESEFDNIFQGWWNDQMSYDSVEDFGRNASWEDAHSLYLHLLPHTK